MHDSAFREYDIRGKVNDDFSIVEMYDLTRAIAYYFRMKNPALKTIAVGMDGRIHSSEIRDLVCQGLIDSGLDVLILGLCPSPALYFALHTTPVDGGLMITASHNPKEYNGLKICLGTNSVWGAQLQDIKLLYHEKKHIFSQKKGTMHNYPIIPSYIALLTKQFCALKNFNLPIVIDCGNGTAGAVLPDLLQTMQWRNMKLLYPEVDGTYPNHEADPTVEKNMANVKELITDKQFSCGIGFDGDCDRMAVMTHKGTLVPGDQLLALFAHQVLKEHPHAGIVFDIKSSSGLSELLEQWNAQPILSPSGHSIIKDMMHKHHAILGGELSCHFFFHDRYFGYDDGIYAMVRLFEILQQSNQSLTELLACFPHKESSPEFRLPCSHEKKQSVLKELNNHFARQKQVSILTIDGIRVTFPFGWGIVRPSNTQPVLSMRFESNTRKGLHAVIDDFYTILGTHLSCQELDALHRYREEL